MKRHRKSGILAIGVSSLLVGLAILIRAADEGPGGPPYPNDAGPAEIDVTQYPPDMQANYKVFARRCSQCHSLARPINSENLQLTADEQTAAKTKEPDLFKFPKIWRISDSVWTDYVKKMQSKPGAIIRETEIPKITSFLVYDSKVRKTGDNRAAWQAQRQKLLDDFKKSNPQRYDALFAK